MEMAENSVRVAKELPVIFGDFTSQESWDCFFSVRGVADYSEWYADWPQLRPAFLSSHLSFPPAAPPREELSILVPACGYSRLSEHLYDEGFRTVTNVDFSKVVVSAMLRRNVKERPLMRWRVMDMTNMQFANGSYDVIIDKGGLDALMEHKIDPRFGTLYLSEVKRLLKAGGKYICLTSAESRVLGLLLSKFRFGWKVDLHSVAQDPSSGITFVLVAEKYIISHVSQIKSFVDEYSVESHGNQVQEVFEALEKENTVRAEYSNGTGKWYSIEELKLGVKGNIRVLEPLRSVCVFLGGTGSSRFFYNSVLFDAIPKEEPFTDQFRVLFFQNMLSFQDVFVSRNGPWGLVRGSNAARVLMVGLDASHSNLSLADVVRDITDFVKELAPMDGKTDVVVTSVDEGLKWRKIVYEVTSALTGTIVVEDVIYKEQSDVPKDSIFRRLYFRRTETIMQSEALLSTKELEIKKVPAVSRTWKKGKSKKFVSPSSSDSHESSGNTKVDHEFLACEFHQGMIAGLLLFSIHSKRTSSAGGFVKTVIIGLGAGLLPMCMRKYIPSLKIEVVELDPVVLKVAKEYFDFAEDERLKVHITDPIKFVREIANSDAEGKNDYFKVDVLIVDVNSSDLSSGLITPEAEFVEEHFLVAAKESLSYKGLLITKLARNFGTGVRTAVYSNLRKVFSNVFSMKMEVREDFCELIFALKKESPVELGEACAALGRSLEYKNNKDWVKKALADSKMIQPLKKL
ncbi:hypothetical protein ABFS82_02G055800 [Erythranthe guttata]